MEDLEIKLKRQEFSSTATMGVMSVNGLRIADTLEDTQRKLPETCPYTPKGSRASVRKRYMEKPVFLQDVIKLSIGILRNSEKNILLLKTCLTSWGYLFTQEPIPDIPKDAF